MGHSFKMTIRVVRVDKREDEEAACSVKNDCRDGRIIFFGHRGDSSPLPSSQPLKLAKPTLVAKKKWFGHPQINY